MTMSNDGFDRYFPESRLHRDRLRFEIPVLQKTQTHARIPNGYEPMGLIYAIGRSFRGLIRGYIPWWVLISAWLVFGQRAVLSLVINSIVISNFGTFSYLFPVNVLSVSVIVLLLKATISKIDLDRTHSIFVPNPQIIFDSEVTLEDLSNPYVSLQVNEDRLRHREIVYIEVIHLFSKTKISFRLKPEMRNKKVQLYGVFENGAVNLLVKIKVM